MCSFCLTILLGIWYEPLMKSNYGSFYGLKGVAKHMFDILPVRSFWQVLAEWSAASFKLCMFDGKLELGSNQ